MRKAAGLEGGSKQTPWFQTTCIYTKHISGSQVLNVKIGLIGVRSMEKINHVGPTSGQNSIHNLLEIHKYTFQQALPPKCSRNSIPAKL